MSKSIMKFNAYKRGRLHHYLDMMSAAIRAGNADRAKFYYGAILGIKHSMVRT